MKKTMLGITVAVALALLIAGCSRPAATTTATRTTTPTTTATTSPATTTTRTATPTTTATTTPPTTTAATTPPPVPPAPARTYAIPGEQVFPEGIAYDATSNSFFTGSTNDGTVFRGTVGSGDVKVFSAAGADSRTAAIGMKVDSQKRRLWVAGGGTGQVFVYNIDTGALVRKYSTPAVASTFLNDIALAPNGDAYITDSRRPVLFKIPGSGAEPGDMESWLDFTGTAVQYSANATSLNGIVVSNDGAYIVVVHSGVQKLYRITVANKEVREVDLGGAPQGGDGMVLDGQTLYVCERFQGGDRIVRIDMAADLSSGRIRDNFRDDSFGWPTTIAKVGGRMLVVNSQFNNRGGTPTLPFTVSDIVIPR